MNNADLARGAALAGALLLALPFLDLLLGGESAAAVRAVVGTCGLGLLGLSAALDAECGRRMRNRRGAS